jgi:hypothetical protein
MPLEQLLYLLGMPLCAIRIRKPRRGGPLDVENYAHLRLLIADFGQDCSILAALRNAHR